MTAAACQTLIVGCGYLGATVGSLCVERGDVVYATTRRRSRADRLQQMGFVPLIVDWNDRRTLCQTTAEAGQTAANLASMMPNIDQVLVAVSYDLSSQVSRYESQVGGMRNLLRLLPNHVKVCYISTTGVYHQTDGRWVDESSPTFPRREGGRVHLQAESLLHRYRPTAPWTVLRLAGIYGPGRVPRIADVVAGRSLASQETGFLNLIHVHDAARAVLATWQHRSRRVYAVADDQPMQRGDFYREMARRCAAPPPTFRSPLPGSSKQMRSESNKRIWNRRLKHDLLPNLLYPTYRDGLAQILADGRDTKGCSQATRSL
ncbi:NAD-dependent epimerase/dehydratase family protein [Novipirellula artificiosorum]|uniref:NAD dependent epimerase/dehydratase family protein n=1 Tax=Novipirellula artificiosorum TaxID=2528016 RepID=A0A5C6DNZ7_9BACT|nr:NAD-dependent epimerase/dehydratase family protein [Novipirellula artificiosorum]TWU38448.1 NAD dependent epimerase/dehydratase family protein [Novipirellula artificiosorum]